VREIPIPLGSQRDQERTRSDARFLELRNEIHHLIGRPREATGTVAAPAAPGAAPAGIRAEPAR
jgi:hypothetical protein